MVRYDQCVESLYDRALVDDRTKALQIIKVMKGAISMSKSRTGECIFRTNKTVKKDLERLVNIETRNSNYNISRIDTSKKFVVERWTRMLENHTSCTPQTLFEEVLGLSEPGTHPPSEKTDSQKLKSLIDLRLDSLERESTAGGYSPRGKSKTLACGQQSASETQDPNGNGDSDTQQFVTERKDLRDRYISRSSDCYDQNSKQDGASLNQSNQLNLPSVPGVRRELTHMPMMTSSEQNAEDQPIFERDYTDWSNWALKDKGWITSYIHREKTKHEDLIIRNALNKIESEMSGANMIKRHQLRQKLQNDHSQREIEQRKQERMRREREKAREILKLPSGPETHVSAMKTDKSNKKKHVGFCEPVVVLLDTSVKTKKKPLIKSGTFHVTLPKIAETSAARKRVISTS